MHTVGWKLHTIAESCIYKKPLHIESGKALYLLARLVHSRWWYRGVYWKESAAESAAFVWLLFAVLKWQIERKWPPSLAPFVGLHLNCFNPTPLPPHSSLLSLLLFMNHLHKKMFWWLSLNGCTICVDLWMVFAAKILHQCYNKYTYLVFLHRISRG